MDYIKSNKEAWEESFEFRKKGWGEEICDNLKNEKLYLEKELIEELKSIDFNGKTVGQFCCNNGRELLSLMQLGAEKGIGFDIAENMVAYANETAFRLNSNCEFVACNILDIDEKYHEKFDYILVAIGAMCWFESLEQFFSKVSKCLKKGGKIIINEMHPFGDMLAVQGDEGFEPENPKKIVHSYYRKEPWVDNGGMFYMTNRSFESKTTFYSYSHNFSDIINGLSINNIFIKKLRELETDVVELFPHLNNQGIPLSYILIGEKII